MLRTHLSQGIRESDRLAALAQTGLMDTAPEPEFDTVVAVAARMFRVPMASVTLVDDHRQFCKASIGLDHRESPLTESFCAVAVHENAPLVVEDARLDPRFQEMGPVVGGELVAYAGVPVAGRDGLPLGTICVIDVEPRRFSAYHVDILESLGRIVGDEFDLRRRDALAGIDSTTARTASAALVRAIDDDELTVRYQPIVDLRTGGVRSVEALVRWDHPTRGLLPPEDFLPLAEVSGFAHRIDRHVLHTAVATAVEIRGWSPRLADLGVAVNVGLWPSIDKVWAVEVQDLLQETGLPADALTLEVSERSLDGATETARDALETLVRLGCRLAVDDIGTGTSSLMRLAELPATEVKLDRTFVQTMVEDPRRAAVVGAVARLGRDLELDVVAEGVENAETAQRVADLGCTDGQGYHWAAPLSRTELFEYLLDRAPVRRAAAARPAAPGGGATGAATS